MQISHNNEANENRDDANKFNVIVRICTRKPKIRDFLVKNNEKPTDNSDGEADEQRSKAEIPFHNDYYTPITVKVKAEPPRGRAVHEGHLCG